MTDTLVSQFEATLVTRTLDGGVLVVSGLTPSAPSTLVLAVADVEREYQVTSSRPAAVAVRSAGNMFRPPEAGRSRTTGCAWTGPSEVVWKLCSRMSPSGWKRVSFQTMLTVPYRSLTASRGKSLTGNRL